MSVLKSIWQKTLQTIACAGILLILISGMLFLFFMLLPHGGMINVLVDSTPIELEAQHFEGEIRAKTILLRMSDSGIQMPLSFTTEEKKYSLYPDGSYSLVVRELPDIYPELKLTTETGYFRIHNQECDSFQVRDNAEITLKLGVNDDLRVSDSVLIWCPLNEFTVEVLNNPNAYIINDKTKETTPIQSFVTDQILEINPKNYTLTEKRPLLWITIDGEKDITFSQVHKFNNDGRRTVSLYKTANAQIIDYRGTIEIQGNLTARLTDALEISGNARELTIMGNSVFPGFWSWLNDNAYVIPSMILTVFSGAIAMSSQLSKKEKKTEKVYFVTVEEKCNDEQKTS